jgi:polysaccharide export outer membrane protein
MRRIIITFLIYIIVGFLPFTFSYAQEKQDARLEARQHYLQGQDYYSRGRYREAVSEFEKAIELISPARIEFMRKARQQAQDKEVFLPSTQAEQFGSEFSQKQEKEAGQELTDMTDISTTTTTQVVSSEDAEERQYYLDIGDVLDISVWQIPDLSRPEVIVRPDGKISFPLIGDIGAEGLTLTQLDNIITERLKTYIKAPEVSVMIRRFGGQSNKFVILGEIYNPGIYKFSVMPTITELIAAAGGYTKYAVLNSVMLIRGDVKVKPKAKRINLARILKHADLSQNISLKPNDIIYVPRSFIGKINTFLEIFQPAINEYFQTLNARHLQHVVHSKGGV